MFAGDRSFTQVIVNLNTTSARVTRPSYVFVRAKCCEKKSFVEFWRKRSPGYRNQDTQKFGFWIIRNRRLRPQCRCCTTNPAGELCKIYYRKCCVPLFTTLQWSTFSVCCWINAQNFNILALRDTETGKQSQWMKRALHQI